MSCEREREYARPMQEARWKSKGKATGQGTGQKDPRKKKIQDKFPAQESSYSVITVDAKVKKLKHAVHIKCYLCFPSQMKEKYRRTERKCFLTQCCHLQDDIYDCPHSN